MHWTTIKMVARLEDTMTWEEIAEHVIEKIRSKLRSEKEVKRFRKWFISRKDVGYLFDYIMIFKCYRIWCQLNKDEDHFIVISGKEGRGKSTFSFQIASWICPEFSVKNTVYSAHDYVKVLQNKLEKLMRGEEEVYEVLILDEGTELMSRDSLKITNKVFGKTFFIQRRLHFVVIVNIPNFHMLDSTVRLHRVDTLIQISVKGNYKCIVGKGIKIVNKMGFKEKEVLTVKIPSGMFWTGNWSKRMPPNIDKDEYDRLKLDGIRRTLEELRDETVLGKMVPLSKVSKEMSVSTESLIRMIKKQEIEGKKIGGKWYMTRSAYEKMMTV